MATVEVVGVRDREVRQRTLVLGPGAPELQVGVLKIVPDTLTVTWTRERIVSAEFKSKAGWRMVALEASGPRKVAGLLRHDDHRTHRFSRVADAPPWMTTLANRHIPTEEFGEE